MEEEIKDNAEKENKEVSIPMKFDIAKQKYEPDMEKLNEKVDEINQQSSNSNSNSPAKPPTDQPPTDQDNNPSSKEPEIIKDKSGKEGSWTPMIIVMMVSLLIAYLWDKIPVIQNSVHAILDPTAGVAMDWNLNVGMLIVVFVITILTTVAQKYLTDQKTLKALKKEGKEIQKKMKELKHDPKKSMELQKEQFKLFPKQMKLSMRALVYTGVPFILFFRWFGDYFAKAEELAGEPVRLWLGMSWFLFYLLGAIIIGMILRKQMDVV